jgi:siroheme synthase-like protein
MAGFPVELRLEGRRVLAIGAEAEEKVRRAVEAGAQVTLVTPEAAASLAELARAGALTWHARELRDEDLDGVDLVLLTTRGVPELAERLRAECRARRALLWTHDYTPACDLTFTGLVESGPVRLAVSTGGRAPALARAVRLALERLLDADFAAWAWSVARARATDDDAARKRRVEKLRVEGRLRWDD